MPCGSGPVVATPMPSCHPLVEPRRQEPKGQAGAAPVN